MCGVVGAISLNSPLDRRELRNAANAIRHRGPDFQGEWWSEDGRIGLAHQRLSIIDLDSSANQPMLNSDKSAIIIFNGEIYNFKLLKSELSKAGFSFSTQSDTEVLLTAYKYWGKECVNHLEGMFAFAILDFTNQELFLARDPAGEKPLYIYKTDNQFLFASEIKALLQFSFFDKKINFESLEYALMNGYVPSGSSIFFNLFKLFPGETATYSLLSGQLVRKKFWKMDGVSKSRPKDDEEWMNECESLLSDSIQQQLFADVPVGILLSGGVDSSLITAIASKFHTNLKTFTVTFKGQGKFDESDFARLISNTFCTQHQEIEAEEINPKILPIIAAQLDEPMFDSSAIPSYYVTKAIRSHCSVALGGDGADEVFGGYSSYVTAMKYSQFAKLLTISGATAFSNYLLRVLPEGYKGRNVLSNLSANYKHSISVQPAFFIPASISKIIGRQTSNQLEGYGLRSSQVFKCDDLLTRCMRLDFEQYLPEDILVKMDRMSMLNSLEVRSPFLSKKMLDFSQTLPNNLKADTKSSKILLRKLAKKILPPQFDSKRKQGFSVPLKKWLQQTEWNNYFKEILLDSSCSFNKNLVSKLFTDHEAGRSNNERLYALVMLELWRKHYSISLN
jgi:asparagine synthase (glutamine-hydrolysing)